MTEYEKSKDKTSLSDYAINPARIARSCWDLDDDELAQVPTPKVDFEESNPPSSTSTKQQNELSYQTLRKTPQRSKTWKEIFDDQSEDGDDQAHADTHGPYKTAQHATVTQSDYGLRYPLLFSVPCQSENTNILPFEDEEIIQGVYGLEFQATRAIIEELTDLEWSNPNGADKHDELARQFFTSTFKELPPSSPARHMHHIYVDAYNNEASEDPVLFYIRPRLCDGIATVLAETGIKCLEAFLDPQINMFEWRRAAPPSNSKGPSSSIIIRRQGNEVMVGMYRTHAFHLIWTVYVKCSISYNGKWTEIYAHNRGSTPVTNTWPVWDEFTPLPMENDQDPADPKFALHIGRNLSRYLLRMRVWIYYGCPGTMVEWQADGKSTVGLANDVSSVYRPYEKNGENLDDSD